LWRKFIFQLDLLEKVVAQGGSQKSNFCDKNPGDLKVQLSVMSGAVIRTLPPFRSEKVNPEGCGGHLVDLRFMVS
jgi:hypothetical protein